MEAENGGAQITSIYPQNLFFIIAHYFLLLIFELRWQGPLRSTDITEVWHGPLILAAEGRMTWKFQQLTGGLFPEHKEASLSCKVFLLLSCFSMTPPWHKEKSLFITSSVAGSSHLCGKPQRHITFLPPLSKQNPVKCCPSHSKKDRTADQGFNNINVFGSSITLESFLNRLWDQKLLSYHRLPTTETYFKFSLLTYPTILILK